MVLKFELPKDLCRIQCKQPYSLGRFGFLELFAFEGSGRMKENMENARETSVNDLLKVCSARFWSYPRDLHTDYNPTGKRALANRCDICYMGVTQL